MNIRSMVAAIILGLAMIPASSQALAKVQFCGSTNVADIVLRNFSTHQLAVWCDGNPASSVILGTFYYDVGWFPMLVGDFDGDGTSDVLLYNYYNSQVSYWPNGNPALGSITGTVAAGWSPFPFVGDLNGDGRDDFILYGSNTREVSVWYSANASTSAILGTVTTGWKPISAADVNGDGHADLILEEFESSSSNHPTGRFSYWLSGNPASSALIASPGYPWTFMAAGNFVAGAPACDLLWVNLTTNQLATSTGCNSVTLSNFSSVGSAGHFHFASGMEDANGDGVTDVIVMDYIGRWVGYFPSALGSPTSPIVLGSFYEAGGWDVLHTYFSTID